MSVNPRVFLSVARRTVALHGGVANLLTRMAVILRREGMRGIRGRLEGLFATGGPASRSPSAGPPAHDGAVQVQPQVGIAPSGPDAAGTGKIAAHLQPGALLVGHPYGVSGRGEDVRTTARAFARMNMPFGICNTFGEYGRHTASMHRDFPLMDRITAENRYRCNIFHINADEMEHARRHRGADFFAGRYNIGYWAWELSEFPDAWLPAFSLVDEIWAPSRFTQQAISEKAPCPVLRMPLGVELPEVAAFSRRDLGLPEDRFLFLFFFDFTSYLARKNPWATIRAFKAAFGDDAGAKVGLVIKTNGMALRPEEARHFLQADQLDDPRIVVLDKVMEDREIRGLVRSCDCFVSLHRSEGYGRGPAEAMFFGKPVIVTGYSGNLDFTNELNACMVDYTLVPVREGEYPHGAGQIWAEADVDQAAWYMQRLVADPSHGVALGRVAADFIRSHCGAEAVGRRYRARLDRLGLL